MKFLKWLLIVVLILAALMLIIPLFMPGTISVTSEKEINVTPAQIFYNVALYTDRGNWDPWLETDPDAEWATEPQPDYVGSFYTWNGKKVGTGKEIVDSVVFGQYIAASITFGEENESSLVEWNFNPVETGTSVKWSFTSHMKYPIGRLMLNLMKGTLKNSFDKGLDNLKVYLEANPPLLSMLGQIQRIQMPPMFTMVMAGKGTMEDIGTEMPVLYGKLMAEMSAQGLQMTGAPFSHYRSFDEISGITEYLAGIVVSGKARDAGDIKAVKYPAMDVIQAIHTGPYEELQTSYGKLMEYIALNQLKVTGEAFEFYFTEPSQEPDITRWQTMIAFPLK